jgi:beta-glucosidase-like glycosyl hydrolase
MQETIRGMQEAGVQANAKHFIGNEQVFELSSSKACTVSDAALGIRKDDDIIEHR